MSAVRMDTQKFQASFRKSVARSKARLPVAVNQTLYDVAAASVDEVKRADRQDIEALGVSAYQVLKKKGGLLKHRKIIYGAVEKIRMTAIYAAMLRKKGIDPRSIPAGEFEKNVKRALAGRLKSVGFVASSFVPVLRKMASKLGISAYRPTNAPTQGRAKGNAKPAVEGWKCTASFEVSAGLNVENPTSRSRVRQVLESAITAGFNKTADRLEKNTTAELNKVWKS